MMEAVRTSETSVDNHFTRQYIPEDNSEQNICIHVVLPQYKLNTFLFCVDLLQALPISLYATSI
jgi:hypothetical protein